MLKWLVDEKYVDLMDNLVAMMLNRAKAAKAGNVHLILEAIEYYMLHNNDTDEILLRKIEWVLGFPQPVENLKGVDCR